jgi:hypothetical protein
MSRRVLSSKPNSTMLLMESMSFYQVVLDFIWVVFFHLLTRQSRHTLIFLGQAHVLCSLITNMK